MSHAKVVEVSSLTKKYGSFTAVNEISFTVDKAEIFAFLGPNGAGKTTTVEILECLVEATEGEIHVLGYDIEKNKDEIRKRIGVLPQEFNTFNLLTVKENIEYFASLFEKEVDVDNLIKLVDLDDKRNTYYEKLSGGLKQRLGIAIALVNDPEIIFLDEPTAGLDPKARRSVWKVITGLKSEGKTVFLTTHYMEEAEVLADRVTMIDAGKIVASNTPTELISKYGGKKSIIVRNVKDEQYAIIKSIFKNCILDNKRNLHLNYQKNTDLTKFMEFLTTNKIQFEEMELKKPNLEDAFLNLIGSKINDEGTLY